MQELLTFVAKSLVDHPDQVRVQKTEGPEGVILELNVAEEDMGKVIGKQGRIAKAIRSVVKAATPKDSPHVFVEIQRPLEDFDEPGEDAEEADEAEEAEAPEETEEA